MTCVPDTWHAPPGCRIVTTNERVCVEQAKYLSRARAERRAGQLNDHRFAPSYEWRVEQVGHRFRLVAFQNVLEAIDDERIAA